MLEVKSNGDGSVYQDEEKIRSNLDLIDKILTKSQQNDSIMFQHHADLN